MLNRIFPMIGFITCALLFWPGLLRPDSITQFHQALAWSFNDSHPPMFGIVLWLLSKIYDAPGLTLLLNLALYWSGIALYANIEKTKSWWYFLIAIFPPILAYQLLVIKDIAFVNSYIFLCAWLHYYNKQSLKPSKISLISWLIIAFYGTACTYQAAIALPWLCLWLGKIYWPNDMRTWIIHGVAIFIGLASAVFIFNKQLVHSSDRSQQLKLYDLAGISIQINQPIFPKYLETNPHFNWERVKILYNPKRVDDLIFCQDTPLPMAITADQRQELHNAWISAIIAYPIAYLKHRFGIFKQQLTVSLLKTPDEIKGEVHGTILKLLEYLKNSWIFEIAKWLMSCIGYVILQIALIYQSIKHFKEHPIFTDIFFQNMSGLSLTMTLFFVANAAEARYAYLTIVTCCFSLPMLINIRENTCNH